MPPSLALVGKLAVVGGLAAVGVGAAVIVPSVPVASAAPGVWLDAPAPLSTLPIGSVTVLAHSTGTTGASHLEVDGHPVAGRVSTTRTGTLALLAFTWTTTAGSHTLVVHAGRQRSAPRVVVVPGPSPAPAHSSGTVLAAPSLHPSPRKGHPTKVPTSPGPTTSSTAPASPAAPTGSAPATSATPSAPSSSPRAAPPTVTPTRSAPPPAKPTVTTPVVSAALSWCDGTVRITVTASRSSGVSIRVTPGGPVLLASGTGSTWTAQIGPDQLPPDDFDQRDSYSLIATATGPGGSATSSAGTLTMSNCKP